MILNNDHWSNERGQLKRVGGAREFDASALLSAKVKAMIQRLDHLNVNIASSNVHPPLYKI